MALVKQYIMNQLNMRESEGEVVTIYKNKAIEYLKLEEKENKILK